MSSDDLREYLREQGEQGCPEGEGQFTLAEKEAIRKLGAFQLPFEGAWILKIVQALVAGGTTGTISVRIAARWVHIDFEAPPSWTVEAVRRALLSATPPSEDSLQHLVVGLRAVAFKDSRRFRLALAGAVLEWNGAFEIVERERRHTLSVEHVRTRASASEARGSQEVATLIKVLRERAFTCPLELQIDSVVSSGLAGCPSHGFNRGTVPISTLHSGAVTPQFVPPPPVASRLPQIPTFPRLTKFLAGQWSLPPKLGCLAVVCAHIRPIGGSHWRVWSCPSYCYWIRDGVVVERARIPLKNRGVSVGLYLSASGLDTDLTTLSLLSSSEKNQRFQAAARELTSQLDGIDLAGILYPAKQERELGTLANLIAPALGSVVMFGLKPVLLPLLLTGAVVLRRGGDNARQNIQEQSETLLSALCALCEQWSELFSPDPGSPDRAPTVLD